MDQHTYDRGREIRAAVLGEAYVAQAAGGDEFAKPFQDLVTEYCWGAVWGRDGLSRKTRSMLNLAMIAGDALPRGGTLMLGAEQAGGKAEIVIRGEGARIILDETIRAALSGGGDEITTRTAMAHLVRSVADQTGGQIMLSAPGEPFLLFGASLPAG